MDFFNGSGKGSYLSDLFGPEAPDELRVPSSFYASKAQYPEKVRLQWDRVSGADYYLLERGDAEEGPFVDMGVKIYSTSYDDRSVALGARVWYRLRAYSRDMDIYSEYTAVSSGYRLSQPTGVNASKGTSTRQIVVSWDQVEGAYGYEVYRSTETYPPNSPLRRVTGIETSVTIPVNDDEKGVEFNFWLRSVNRSGSQSDFSNSSLGFALPEGAPPMPLDLTASQGTSLDSIELSWTGNGADFFYVFRWSEVNSQEENITPEGITESTFTDSDVDNLRTGIRYIYAIQSVKRDEVNTDTLYKSAFSESAKGYLLSPPEELQSRWNGENVALSWAAVPGAETEEEIASHSDWSYQVEYAPAATGPFTTLSTVAATEASNGRVSYQHVAASNPVFYRVLTLNGAALQSAPSDVNEPVTAAVTALTVSRNATPNSGETENRNDVFPTRINWTAPLGAMSYRVERSSTQNGTFEALGTVTTTSFIDSTDARLPGKHYFYRIVPLNSLSLAGDLATPVSGYGAVTDEAFFVAYFNATISPSHRKLTKMHRGGLDALGSETKNGSVSGNVAYNASGGLGGATITMRYTNYCDTRDNLGNPYMIANGNSNTSIGNITNQSGSMNGVMQITGMYTGSVNYGSVQINGGAASGGTYNVRQGSRPETRLDWRVIE